MSVFVGGVEGFRAFEDDRSGPECGGEDEEEADPPYDLSVPGGGFGDGEGFCFLLAEVFFVVSFGLTGGLSMILSLFFDLMSCFVI